MDDEEGEVCLFRPRLEEMFVQCGLTTARLSGDPKQSKKRKHCSNEGSVCFNTDCHIVLCDDTNPLDPFTYGARLLDAKLDSEELRKLEALFAVLKSSV